MPGNEKPLLSICCLGYRHANYLSDALQSICDIGYERMEVIAVDDGSGDDSVERLEAWRASVPFPMTVIAQDNTGNIGLNFNNAYRIASGELIAFIALDDVYHSRVMLKLIEMMCADQHLAFIAATKTVSIDDEGYVTGKADQLAVFGLEDASVEALLELEYEEFGSFYAQSAIFRKSVIDDVGGFDEDMTGDDIVLRTKVLRYVQSNPRYTFRILDECSFFYRLHRQNIHRNFGRQIRIVTQYLDRYWPDRPNPKILVDWSCSYVSDNRFDDSLEFFSLNTRTAGILAHPRIRSRLRKSLKEEVSLLNRFGRFLYSRTKLEAGRRNVVLLGFFTFEYSRKKKPKKSRHAGPPVHFSHYK